MVSDLQPYKYRVYKPDYFSFTTDNGAEYECYFLSASEYFKDYPDISSNIFTFNLDLVSKPKTSRGVDKRIAHTVVTIVAAFLASQTNAVIYVCDTTDNREKARFRKFKSWFDYFQGKDVQQINASTEIEGIILYNAMLIHRKNKQRLRFIQAFLDLNDSEK